jgi:voltage-gated potassium channel
MRWRPQLRPLTALLEGPASVRNAIRLIVAATVVTTVVGGILAWSFDRPDFPTVGDALWWSLQTVTTVGYGDVTPRQPIGRLIGSAVVLYAVAFLSLLTAAITTSFVERSRRERGVEPDAAEVLDRLDAVATRLERLERAHRTRGPGPPSPGPSCRITEATTREDRP